MTRKLFVVALASVASAGAASHAAPPRQAAPVLAQPREAEPIHKLDHAEIKARKELAAKAAGIVPPQGGGVVVRGVCPNSVSGAPNAPIPQFANNTPGVVTDVIQSAGDPLLNVRVRLNILHTWQGDVIARLRHDASGVEVTLIDRPGVPEDSIVGFDANNYGDSVNGIPFVLDDSAPFTYDVPNVTDPGIADVTGSWRPDDLSFSLASFNGLTSVTTWTLTVSDNAAVDSGTLVSWSICSDNALGGAVPTGVGSASPNTVVSGDPVTFTVAASPAQNPASTGLAVTADLSQIGGSFSQTLFDNGTNGDAVAGDNIFTFATTANATSGAYSVPFTVSDAQARSSNGSIALQVVAANDVCPGEAVTAPLSLPGSTVGMTPSGVTSCGANSADVYYNFTPPVSGSYTIDLCGSSFDTRLSVFTDCPALTQIGCNDDSCGTRSSLTLDLAANVTYYIRVSAFGATTTGDFILNISAPPIPTGACCNGNACTVLSEADCLAGGGSYVGDDTPCVTPGPNEFTYTSDPFFPIPDNSCAGGYSQDTIFVSDNFTIGDVNVRVQVPDHTFLGDMQIRLTNGVTTVLLMDDQCGVNDGMDITFDDSAPALVCTTPTVGTFRPTGTTAGTLSAFNGAGANGGWTLEICDDAGHDIGTLTSWSLILRDSAPSPCEGGPQFCDADWCQDGAVGVPDIFCFLSDWFAMDPDARNFGGTPGVPAIFAFLSEWFSTGQGPCTP